MQRSQPHVLIGLWHSAGAVALVLRGSHRYDDQNQFAVRKDPKGVHLSLLCTSTVIRSAVDKGSRIGTPHSYFPARVLAVSLVNHHSKLV